MNQLTTKTNQLQLPEVEVDLGFGEEPQLLAHVSDDPMHISVIGVILSIVILCMPGAQLLLLACFWLLNGSDIAWALGEDEEDEFEGDTLETQAQAVIDSADETEQSVKLDCLGNAISEVSQPSWPPSVEVEPVVTGFTRAKDVIAQSSPADLLNLMGDDAPDWLKLQVAQSTFEYPEPRPEERLDAPVPAAAHTPEVPLKSVVSEISSFEISPETDLKRPETISEISPEFQRIFNNSPYVVPVIGTKGNVFYYTKTCLNKGMTQTEVCDRMFGAKPGSTTLYKNAVDYIKWVKSQ